MDKLLELPFPGRDELRQQMNSISGRVIEEYNDNYGSLELFVTGCNPAPVTQSVPVEAEYLDRDGIPVWVLLHVAQGLLVELEICRADGLELVDQASAERICPFSQDYEEILRRKLPPTADCKDA